MPQPHHQDLRGAHLHFDPHAGIAGDMTVAALVDLGVPAHVVTEAINSLNLKGLTTRFESRKRGAFMATGFVVSWPAFKPVKVKALKVGPSVHPHAGHHHEHSHAGHDHEHRRYAEIKRLLKAAPLDSAALQIAEDVFQRIAVVEAERHGVPVDEVAFHEVGAWDSIADIVGAAAALAYLSPVAISSTPPVLGTGSVKTAHGLLSVPAPATSALLQGLPVISEGVGELTTPTGAAILATVVQNFGSPPPMRLLGTGYGAGTKELADRPNVLRLIAGAAWGRQLPPASSDVLLVEANIDDMTGELLAGLIEALFFAGAVDAWSSPIFMKKGRPAVQVSALIPPHLRRQAEAAFFCNSSTLGVRIAELNRTVLARSEAHVQTPWGDVRIKLGAYNGEPITASPEYDDCRGLADKAQVPVRKVYAAAQALAQELLLSAASVAPAAPTHADSAATKHETQTEPNAASKVFPSPRKGS